MKEIKDIVAAYKNLKNSNIPIALGLVINIEGSSYRRTGARMLIREDGIYTGGISGGCIEGDALKKAQLAMMNKKPVVVTYDTSDENDKSIGVSLGCEGIITIQILPIDKSDHNNPVEQLINCLQNREPKVLITVVKAMDEINYTAGQVILYKSDNERHIKSLPITIHQEVSKVISDKQSILKSYPSSTLFIEYMPPSIQLVLLGSNYDVYPLLRAASNLGWDSVVVANVNRLNNAIRQEAGNIVGDLEELTIDDYTVAVIMSHDYHNDLQNLRKAINTTLPYIGLLGPTVRRIKILNDLEHDLSKSDYQRIFGPAGLDIGADQPEEIAIAIIAEIIAVMRSRQGTSLKYREGPIYSAIPQNN